MSTNQTQSHIPQPAVSSQPTDSPKDRILFFNGPVTNELANKLRVMLIQIMNQKAEAITIVFSSSGGSVDEGVALYNFLSTFPVKLRMHAVGVVASIAILIFLAVPERIASPNTRFFFHDFTWSITPSATRTLILEADMLLESAFEWTTNVYKAKTTLTDADISKKGLLKDPCIMLPPEAMQCGIVQKQEEPVYSSLNWPLVVI